MKNLIAGLLVAIMLYAPVSSVSAQVTEATFNDLMATLLALGKMITTSTTLTDAESLNLMTQLVTLSGTIMTMKEEYRKKGLIDGLPPSDDGKVTAEQAKLDRIILSYEAGTERVSIEMEYSTTTLKRSYTFTPSSPNMEYGEKLGQIITDAETQLSNQTGVIMRDIKDVMYVTSRNPIRDTTVIHKNSDQARRLAENFARYSIVNRIEVRPNSGRGEIEMYTDQDESLRLTLIRNQDTPGSDYTFFIQFFFPSRLTLTQTGYLPEDQQETAQYEQSDDDVPEDEIFDFVLGLFTDAPFATAISNYDKRLLRFMTQNSTNFTYSVTDSPSELKVDCYRASDKKAVTEFVRFLADGIEFQREPIEDIIEYVSPVHIEDNGGTGGCNSAPRFF